MKAYTIIIIFLVCNQAAAQNNSTFCSFGLDTRLYPIDIENTPQGPLPAYYGLPKDDLEFWKTTSIQASYGLHLKKNWALSSLFYFRYNLLHRTQGINYLSPSPTVLEPSPIKPEKKKNLKIDIFIDIEKKLKLNKSKEMYLLGLVGVGFTNINSSFDVTLTDSIESIPLSSKHYKGSFLHFGPRICLGVQFKRIKAYLNAYLIEGSDRTNLTSLWTGASISYEMICRRKKQDRNKVSNSHDAY